jgi:hypothetical protein
MVGPSKRSIAWLLVLAVPVGALYGPFLHAHVEEDADHITRTLYQRLGGLLK